MIYLYLFFGVRWRSTLRSTFLSQVWCRWLGMGWFWWFTVRGERSSEYMSWWQSIWQCVISATACWGRRVSSSQGTTTASLHRACLTCKGFTTLLGMAIVYITCIKALFTKACISLRCWVHNASLALVIIPPSVWVSVKVKVFCWLRKKIDSPNISHWWCYCIM